MIAKKHMCKGSLERQVKFKLRKNVSFPRKLNSASKCRLCAEKSLELIPFFIKVTFNLSFQESSLVGYFFTQFINFGFFPF